MLQTCILNKASEKITAVYVTPLGRFSGHGTVKKAAVCQACWFQENPLITNGCLTAFVSLQHLCFLFQKINLLKKRNYLSAKLDALIQVDCWEVRSCVMYYISTTGFLNPASEWIVTPDEEQNDLISCISRDICADEGARCIRPPFAFFSNLSWHQSCL